MSSDIKRAARGLIHYYGDQAVAVAMKRAANLKEDQIEGPAATWRRIAHAAEEIMAEEDGPEKVHDR